MAMHETGQQQLQWTAAARKEERSKEEKNNIIYPSWLYNDLWTYNEYLYYNRMATMNMNYEWMKWMK